MNGQTTAFLQPGARDLATGWSQFALPLLMTGIGLFAITALVLQFDAVPVLAGLTAVGSIAAMLLRPEMATLVVVFLLYINVPAILTQRHGLPEWLAGSFILLLGLPLVRLLLVRRERFVRDPVLGLMLAFLAVLLLASVSAVDLTLALTYVQVYVLEGLLLYWLVINVLRDLTILRRVIWTLLLVGSLLSALCIYQDVTGSYTQEFGGFARRKLGEGREAELSVSRDLRGKREKWDRAQGPVNDPNRFAQIMIVLLPLSIFTLRTANSRVARLCAAGAGLVIVGGVVATLSRGAFVTLALMGITMVALRWIRPSRLLLVAGVLLVIAPVVTPFFFIRLQTITTAGALFSGERADVLEADGAIRGRTTEMLAALNVFLDHPLLGVGPKQFSRYYFFNYSRDPDIKFKDIQKPSRRAHSLYIEMAAETGVAGLTLFLVIAFIVMRRLSRARRERAPDPLSWNLATALWLSLAAYFWTALFLHLSFQRYYWFLLALASAAAHVVSKRAAAGQHVRGVTRSSPCLEPRWRVSH